MEQGTRFRGFNPFQTNGIFHKVTYNHVRMIIVIFWGVTGYNLQKILYFFSEDPLSYQTVQIQRNNMFIPQEPGIFHAHMCGYACVVRANWGADKTSVFTIKNRGFLPNSFQKNLCAETAVGEFAIGLVLAISREPANIETERKNFLGLRVY